MQCIFLNINQPETCTCFYIDNAWRYKIRPSKFEGSLEITQILRSERLLKNLTLKKVNLDKQNKHRSLILMKYRSVTLSKASILFPWEMFTP